MRLFFLLLILAICIPSYGASVNLKCDSEGQLVQLMQDEQSLSEGRLTTCTECRRDGTEALSEVLGGRISLRSPHKGLASNKDSDNYDRKKLDEIIANAIDAGVDPYAALAIVILENPPIFRSKPTDQSNQPGLSFNLQYDQLYGDVPVDNVAAYDLVGCPIIRQSAIDLSKYDQGKIQTLRNLRAEVPALTRKWSSLLPSRSVQALNKAEERLSKLSADPTQNAEKEKLAAEIESMNSKEVLDYRAVRRAIEGKYKEFSDHLTTMNLESYDQLAIQCAFDKSGCRGIVGKQTSSPSYNLAPESTSEMVAQNSYCAEDGFVAVGGNTFFHEKTAGQVGRCCVQVTADKRLDSNQINKLLKSRLGLDYIKKNVQGALKKSGDLALALQRFNGLGCFGCTEGAGSFDGSCMGQIDMTTRPVYGAKAADLMLNTLMKNKVINDLVFRHAEKQKKKVKSMFCLENGAGNVAIDEKKYLNLQKKFLLGGAENNFALAYKEANGAYEVRKPRSESDKATYQRVEAARSLACKKYFD